MLFGSDPKKLDFTDIRNLLNELIHRSQSEYISEDAIAALYVR